MTSSVPLKEKAYIHLRELINSGELAPGTVLTERTLVDMLEMSRTPIRAALERLDAEGLAKYTPNKGLVVSEISLQQIIDVYDFRMAIEGHLVFKLAQRQWTDEYDAWFKENLSEQLQAVSKKNDNRFTDADSAFHRHLATLYGNQEMLTTLNRLQDINLRIALNVLRKDQNRIQISYKDHVAIYEYIRQGNGDIARNCMIEHLEHGKRILIM